MVKVEKYKQKNKHPKTGSQKMLGVGVERNLKNVDVGSVLIGRGKCVHTHQSQTRNQMVMIELVANGTVYLQFGMCMENKIQS